LRRRCDVSGHDIVFRRNETLADCACAHRSLPNSSFHFPAHVLKALAD